jgi:hypothetical protein
MQSLPLQNLAIDENNNIEEDEKYNRSAHVEPFHRQRRIDGSLPFTEQITAMQHIVVTNGLDGRCITTDTDLNQGGIWKDTIHTGIGQKPTIGASV